jgi:hypothetical protein
VFYQFHAELQGFLDNYVYSWISEGMYVNFVAMEAGKDFGRLQQIAFKTTTY